MRLAGEVRHCPQSRRSGLSLAQRLRVQHFLADAAARVLRRNEIHPISRLSSQKVSHFQVSISRL
jgi:hypothetical protein